MDMTKNAGLLVPVQRDARMDEFWENLDSGLTTPTPPPRNLDVGLSDVARAVGAGGLELVGGIGELARQAGNYGRQNGGKDQGDYLENARANLAKKLAPALDVVAGAGELAQSGADSLKEGMSVDAREAMTRSLVSESPTGGTRLADGAGDIDVWAMKMAQGVGSLLPTLASGGITGLAAKATIGRMVTTTMLKRGAAQEVAEAVAAKTVSRLATGAATTTGVTGSVGAAGVNARDAVLGMSFDELRNSTTFRDSFLRIDADQQTAHLSDSEKLQLAREETANVASQATMGDAKTWGAAAVGTLMGDTMLFKMLAGKGAGGGVLKGMVKGAAGEGISEALEEGTQQYSVNEALNEVAGANIDPMKGVVSSAIEGGLIGMGVGGATGGVGGLRGERGEVKTEDLPARDTEPTASEPVSDEQVEPQVTPEPEVPTATDQSPLGPSASQYDELRDVPAYLRKDDTADRFKGMAENSEVQDALAKAPAPTVAELLDQADGQQVEDLMDPESMGDAEAQASLSPTEATIGPLNSLRVTRRGKPFASEKEAQLASHKGVETPVPLNGGGFGVAAIAEIEQVRAMPPIPVDAQAHQGGAEMQLDENNTAELGQLSDLAVQGLGSDADTERVRGDASQQPLVPAVDTGYRDITPSNEQPEVTHDQPAQIPASSSEGQSDHPGSSQPTEVGTELTSTGRTDRAGVRNPTDLPTPDGPQKNDMTLSAPATDAGVVDSGAEIATTRREVSTEKQKESGDIKVPPVDEFKRGLKNGEKATVFSKQAQTLGPAPAKYLTQKEAELITKTWLKRYRGAAGVNIQIHATQAEMERVLGLEPTEGLIRRAAFNRDESGLHIAADTLSAPGHLREVLRHELLAHYGLANVLGSREYSTLISRVIASRGEPSMKPVWEWVKANYNDETLGVQAEEVIAHLAEMEPSAWRRGWDKLLDWVLGALRRVGFLPSGRITSAEVRSLIEGLGKKLQRAGPDDIGPDGGKKFSQEDAQAPTKKGGVMMSQVATTADKAMEKLNLGPKPDIIDKTKTNLDKLRKVDRSVVESWVDRFIKKANTEVLDTLAPIKYAEEAAGITDAADSGYVAARMATGAASTMQATMLYGLPEWKDGVIQRKAGTGEKDALLGIFSDLGADLHNWLGWMAGHRAELLMEQGRENLLSEQDIAALKGLGKGKEAKFMEAKARWNRLNAATLDLAQEAGLFTKEARAEFESEWYIPFFRESDDGDVIAPFKPKGIANQNAGIKKLKGGEANTADLLENIFTSTSKLIDASMKNMAAQKTVWNLADTGIIEVVAKPNMMDWRTLKNGKDLITVKLEGEDYMIRVEDPDLYRAMTFFDRQPFGSMVNMASKAKRLLTAGVTASPEFMLRNFLRDSLSSWAISKDGFKPVIDSIKGVKKTLAMEGSTIDVMFSGASFLGGYVNGNDPTAMADTVRKSLRRKGMTPEQIARYEKSIIRNAAQAKGVVANVWEKYNRYGEALENANREAVYDAAIKAGKSHAQAAFESKDLMDFSMLGASRTMQVMVQVLPFFNARVQGLGKLTRELRDNPRAIAKRAGMITAASLALLAHNWDDERYEELPDWDKDANWHFWLGEHHWRIPKPFEIGVLFGTIPERMVRALGDKDTGAQFGKAVARAIGDTFALNPTPQIVKPMVEAAFNYDSFRGGPIDSPQDLAVKAEARYNEQTSLLMRELGELSGFSPKQLEHLVVGYTGTMGSYVMAVADGLIRAARPGESASWRADEIPLVKAVYRGTGPAKSTQHMEEFYRMLNEVNQLKRTVDQYRSEGLTEKANELLDEQGGILKSRRSLSRTQQQVRVVRNKIELIQRDRTMNAEEKRRRIDALLARRNDLVYQATKHNRKNGE
ncbi:LPD38 domain-containing protein [Aeromonas hydrophila]|uniref:LPD38 domain-containing protein n=1 Tax=Aeromonas hydrophila TaxID=644 RepID=UPI002B497125|nr:LPD38 domain-containing protein [Aeromonas hydrophila]